MAEAEIWDAAIHVYDDAYPCRPGVNSKPPHAPISRYLAEAEKNDIARVVLSQASAYGFDNSLVLDSLDVLGQRGRAVVVLPASTPRSEQMDLHARGVRGIRFMMFPGGALGWADVAPWAAQAADMGWVLKFQLDPEQFRAHAELLASLPAEVIIDVYPGTLTLDIRTLDRLAKILDAGRAWLSLTAPISDTDMAFGQAVRVLVERHAQRCIWASNWPSAMTAVETGKSWLHDLIGSRGARQVMANAGQIFSH